MHTFVRTSEVRFAPWSEFEELDGDRPLWRIPAARMNHIWLEPRTSLSVAVAFVMAASYNSPYNFARD
jgi:hypothetical protein